MGWHDFVASAGRILGLGDGRAQAAKVQHEGSPPPAPPTAEAVRDQVRNAAPNADLRVRIEGDTVHLEGRAPDPEARERAIVAAGNIAGVRRVNDDGVAGPPADQSEFYTVRRGDTLSAIAKRYYGDANKYPAIFEANRGLIKDPDAIFPGWVLRIPRPGR